MSQRFKPGSNRVYVKVHEYGDEVVVAICDAELLGKRIIDEDKGINFYIDPYFYKGELLGVEDALKILGKATIANLVGKRIVDKAVKHGYIHPESILWIKDVPHAQYVVYK
jgi:hypothetical protein